MSARTTKEERRKNAQIMYAHLMNHPSRESIQAIVISKGKQGSCQFKACVYKDEVPRVIAESHHSGEEGCFFELFESLRPNLPQKTMYEDGFKGWVDHQFAIQIEYNDGLVMLFKKNPYFQGTVKFN